MLHKFKIGQTVPLVGRAGRPASGIHVFGSRPSTHALEGRLQGCSSKDTMTTEQKIIRAK